MPRSLSIHQVGEQNGKELPGFLLKNFIDQNFALTPTLVSPMQPEVLDSWIVEDCKNIIFGI